MLSTAFLWFIAVQTLTCSKITENSKQNCFKDVQEVIQQEEVAAQQGRGCTRIRSGDFLTASPALLLLLTPNSQLLFLTFMPHLYFLSEVSYSKSCLKVELKNRGKASDPNPKQNTFYSIEKLTPPLIKDLFRSCPVCLIALKKKKKKAAHIFF